MKQLFFILIVTLMLSLVLSVPRPTRTKTANFPARKKYTHVFNRQNPSTPQPVNTLQLAQQAPRLKCPEENEMWPCQCSIVLGRDMIQCVGYNVTQKSLEESLNALRLINFEEDPQEKLNVTRFILEKTDLISLDLTPFADMSFDYFSITNNQYLTQLRVSPGVQIGAKNLDFSGNVFEDAGFSTKVAGTGSETGSGGGKEGDSESVSVAVADPGILSAFGASVLSLDLSNNKLAGVGPINSEKFIQRYAKKRFGPEFEFLPGFSSLTQLQNLYLQMNRIRVLAGGQFYKNRSLRRVEIYKNGLEELGPGAFALEKPKNKTKKGKARGRNTDKKNAVGNENDTLLIDLSWNSLDDENIHPKHGLDSNGRVVNLLLKGNQFDTLSAENWLQFLSPEANPKNQVSLEYNKFHCDLRMKWLKEERSKFEKRATGIICENDVNKTIFTSGLYI